MIRKNPKSHTYTIGALAIIVIISVISVGKWYVNDTQTQQVAENASTTNGQVIVPLDIKSAEQLGHLLPKQKNTSLQNSNQGTRLQSAGNMQAYNNFEAGTGALHQQNNKVQ